jgi:hypothetical protein
MKASYFSKDIQEFIVLLNKYNVHYVIVGGEAVIYYGYIRVTGDIDFFYDSSLKNAENLYFALIEFWHESIPGIKCKEDLAGKNNIIQFGRPPNRLDLISSIDSITFEEAWNYKVKEKIVINGKTYSVYFIGLNELIKNKNSIKRNKDLDDLKYLYALKKNKSSNQE